jgi:large subunit ribosomal protein L9e
MPVSFKNIGNRRLAVEKYFGVKKEKAAVRTIASHIKNMINGVTSGYRYKMKAVYAHFPINLVISAEGKSVEVKNFLGEKHTRIVRLLDGVTAAQTGQKDEIQLDGNDLELVSRSAALIHQCSKVPNKDIRQFLDGVYVAETSFIHQPK